jgi:hypothetical protein
MPRPVANITIVGGVEGNTRAPHKTRLTKLVNGVYRERGGVSLRYGTKRLVAANTAAVGSVNAVATPETLFDYRDETVVIGKGKLYSYLRTLDAANQGLRYLADYVPEATATYSGIAAAQQVFFRPTVAIGYTNASTQDATTRVACFVWQDPSAGLPSLAGQVYLSVVDLRSGSFITNALQISSGATMARPYALVTGGTKLHIAYCNTSARTLIVRSWDLTNMASASITAEASVAIAGSIDCTTTGSRPAFDITTDGTSLFLAYFATSGANRYKVAKIAASNYAVTEAANGETVTSTAKAISICANSSYAWLAYSYDDGTNRVTKACAHNVSTAAQIGSNLTLYTTTTADEWSQAIGLVQPSSTTCAVVAQRTTDTGGPSVHSWCALTSTNGTANTTSISKRTTYGSRTLISKPFVQDGKVFVWLADTGTLHLVDTGLDDATNTTRLRPVCTVAPRQLVTLAYLNHMALPDVVANGSTWLSTFGTSLDASAFSSSLGVIERLDITFNAWRGSCDAGGLKVIAGGVPGTWDGATFAELGFLRQPPSPTVTVTGSGSSVAAGTYSYKVVSRWVDRLGNVHRSIPSDGTSLTIATANAVNVAVHAVTFTTREDAATGLLKCYHEIHRTVAGGSDYYYVGSVANNPSSSTYISYTDTTDDSVLTANAQLYTAGGVLDNVCPPTAKYAVAHKGRVWLGGTDNDAIWYSKPLVPFEAPAFNEALTIDPFEGGLVTALAGLDEALVIFKADSIYYVTGTPLDETGTNGTLSEPRRIASDVGCTDARSVVLTPAGLMFGSRRGIYLLTRNLTLEFVGEDVADVTQTSGYGYTSAVLVPGQNQVRFGISTGTAANDLVLVFDYLNKAWSKFVYFCTYANANRGPTAACSVNGTYRWITSDSQEYEEDTSTYLDAGTHFVTLDLQTAWFRLTDVLGDYKRVCRVMPMGERHTAHGITVTVESDYDTASAETTTFSEATVTSVGTVEQLQVIPGRQKVEAMRIRVQTTQPNTLGNGRSLTLDALAVEWAPKPNQYRVTSTQRG